MTSRNLNARERQVLGIIIQSYVVTAAPVGSRYIAQNYKLGLSDATIRNVMAELEDAGYISQPHTSAGRIPTDQGYRYYVDLIMTVQSLDEQEKQRIDANIGQFGIERKGASADVLLSAAKVLGSISRNLSVVLSPTLSNAIFEKLDMVLLSSTRMMVILSIQSLFVKTIVMELDLEVSRQTVDDVVDVINERLAGLTLAEIRRSIAKRLYDCDCDAALKNLVVRSAGTLFDESPIFERLYISGTEYIVDQPEFKQPDKVRDLITMIEDKFSMAKLVENNGPLVEVIRPSGIDISISIGKENSERQAEELTIVSTPYYIGNMVGKIGIFGPKRMDYEHAVRVINYMADSLSAKLSDVN
ncbi:heat-inducible transcriptional repressor HrcA [Chlorobium ferrooxidans]|uniref:Heat-inducible transcription repressor HrcA n=1 Tax=Chlorobium ferrooxidans DSM 13031 TaxID=377431 RepID=Q0YS78_9CHLB|nr:heat-inducible transcriptional repressor HrcA [Chlorobium ferrooxidans]EAT59112.1 heat-inducible transcription repressor HrcA [Chlorobium ferrooxidans DSM 13031]